MRPFFVLFVLVGSLLLSACAEVTVPDSRNVDIPTPVTAEKRKDAVNERPDSVMYLPLGEDVLVPTKLTGGALPKDIVGPFELRSETLAGALQLILADYDISIAFETQEGLTRQVTVANLKGPLDRVVNRVCSLADLYCSFEDEGIVVKDKQTFTVSLPPLADADGGTEFITDTIQGLSAVLGGSGTTPASDPTTRTLIYSATQRTAKLAENYFQRLRANTAMIVFETYIWEVSLNSGNSTGVDWDKIQSFGKFTTSIGVSGSISADFTNPVSIGLPTTQSGSPADILEFLSQFGAVKTISQPQITVLSGASAELRVADTENYVSEVSSTISGDQTTTSVSTDSVDSGFTLTIGSSWDKSTVYANVNVNLTNVDDIEDFAFDTDSGGGQTTIQLPQTSERELTTQIRVRPGDSVLIAGLVRESDNFSSRGPGFMEPILPDSRTAQTANLELVILLRPRVIVYTDPGDNRFTNYVEKKEAKVSEQNAVIRPKSVQPAPMPAPKPEVKVSEEPVKITPYEPVKVEQVEKVETYQEPVYKASDPVVVEQPEPGPMEEKAPELAPEPMPEPVPVVVEKPEPVVVQPQNVPVTEYKVIREEAVAPVKIQETTLPEIIPEPVVPEPPKAPDNFTLQPAESEVEPEIVIPDEPKVEPAKIIQQIDENLAPPPVVTPEPVIINQVPEKVVEEVIDAVPSYEPPVVSKPSVSYSEDIGSGVRPSESVYESGRSTISRSIDTGN